MRRYERKEPGEMVHLDIKKLGRFERASATALPRPHRGVGWEFVHIAIKSASAKAGDASRIAFSQVMPDEKKESAIAFLRAVLAYDNSLGVTIARVMTDNGSCYKAFTFRHACRDRGLKHGSYTPKTNGKAERFIHTAFRVGQRLNLPLL